jgi:hypothetical protein|tara:strand:+ start:26 stop:259 length:234 start_codon:yes stop_codon:yes gene_type:complete
MEFVYNIASLLSTLALCYGAYYFFVEKPAQKDNSTAYFKDQNTANKGCLPILVIAFIVFFIIMVFQTCTAGHISVFD